MRKNKFYNSETLTEFDKELHFCLGRRKHGINYIAFENVIEFLDENPEAVFIVNKMYEDDFPFLPKEYLNRCRVSGSMPDSVRSIVIDRRFL